jgi:ribonuclease-3
VRFTANAYETLFERLGHRFKDRGLLKLALTHASRNRKDRHYERLEFLGDRVLGLVIAEELYHRNPTQREGNLAVRHSALVRGDICSEVARSIGLERFVAVGQAEKQKGVNASPTVLADAMEAVIAAAYLDGGLEAARSLILRLWDPYLKEKKVTRKDAKTFLQEWTLGKSLGIPDYRVVSREGPDHAPRFAIEVMVSGRQPARGEGASKRLAEQAAAEAFLQRENLRV